MKKFTKRLLCLVLALTVVMAFCACGSSDENDDEEKTLVGEWEAKIDMTDYFNEMMSEAAGMDLEIEDFSLIMCLEFDKDGTYKMYMDEEHMENMMSNLIDDVWDMVLDVLAEQTGISASEAEELMEQNGVTKDALMEEMDMESLLGEMAMESEGEWVLDGDQLFMDEEDPENAEPVEIEFDGDEFSIIGGEDMDNEMLEAMLPIVFLRQ